MAYADEALNVQIDALANRHVPLVELEVDGPDDLAALRKRWTEMVGVPKLLPTRTDGDDASFLGLDVRTLLRGEESGGRHAAHSIILSPGAEIPAHGLEIGDAAWFVISGDVELTIGSQTRTLKGPAFGYAPPQTTQALANRSAAPAEVYVIHSPAGADRAFATAHRLWRERRDSPTARFWEIFTAHGFAFTQGEALPNDARTNALPERIDTSIQTPEDFARLRDSWSRLAPIPKLIASPNEVRNIPVPDQETRVVLEPEESRAHASVMWGGLQNGFGAPPHHQPSEDEFFIVINGPLALGIGNQFTDDAPPGAFGYAPRHGTHTFKSQAGTVATLFTMNSPAGHERGFEFAVREPDATNFDDRMIAHGYIFHPPEG